MAEHNSAAQPLRGRRIAVLNWRDPWHPYAGGAERYAWEAATALVEAGAEVDYITGRASGQRRSDVIAGVHVRRAGGRFGVYLRTAMALLRRRDWDLVIDTENGIPFFSPLFLRRRTPVILVMHHVHLDQFDLHFPRPLAVVGQILERRVMPFVYRQALVVAVSDSTRRAVEDELHWHPRFELIMNGSIDPVSVPRPGTRSGEPIRLAVLGRLVVHKRVDAVVRAVEILRGRGIDAELDVLGRGPTQLAVQGLVHELGLGDRVRVHGFVEEDRKQELLVDAHLHVCASAGEGWGQVVLEAAGTGLPTVGTDVAGLRDAIRVGETGWLISDTGDLAVTLADQLAEAASELAEPGIAQRYAVACRAWAATFSWPTMRTEMVDVVQRELGAER